MAASRGGQPSLSVHLPQPSSSSSIPDVPPISALFLIDFDVKAGYTIVWKQAVPGLALDGAVEYKSLPSGLHSVSNDLIYFVHEGTHAGLSAFINKPTDEEESRHARMIAVGVLVPLSFGRLGRAWRHAENLKEMAEKLATDKTQTQILQEYWEKHCVRESSASEAPKDTPLESPLLTVPGPSRSTPGRGHSRNRSASDGAALIPAEQRLSPYHPALSLTKLLDTFGPLIFPIHRAALLRKRILISCHAPVHEICNFVYDISVIANIPVPVCDIIDPSAPVERLRPLFTIGIHDIGTLIEQRAPLKRGSQGDNQDDTAQVDSSQGWIACTTDSILAMKEGLWDMLITMPPPHTVNARQRIWPQVECPKGVPVKATQRDLRRFQSLTKGLARIEAAMRQSGEAAPETPGILPSRTSVETARPYEFLPPGVEEMDKIVEPITWAAIAYNGFLWWASAGERRRAGELEEQHQDAALLADLGGPMRPRPRSRPSSSGPDNQGQTQMADSLASLTQTSVHTDDDSAAQAQAHLELAVVAYFHRLTTTFISVLADIIDSTDDDDLMGLDPDDLDVLEPAALAATGTSDDQTGEEERRLLGSGNSRGWVRVDGDALSAMGLDVWSKADAAFVKELTTRYFSRRAHVQNRGFEICGVRVC